MPNATLTVFDEATIVASGGEHFITFNPVEAGTLTITIEAQKQPTPAQAGPHGILATVNLFGAGAKLESRIVPVGPASYNIGYNAAAAQVAAPGSWTVQILNDAQIDIVFDTTITLPTPYPLQTATFDIGLLNSILNEAADDVGIEIHLITDSGGTGDAGMSYVTWTSVLAKALNGVTKFSFVVPDIQIESNDLPLGAEVSTVLPDVLIFRVALGSYPIPGPFLDTASGTFVTSLDFGSGTINCLNFDTLSIRVDSLMLQLNIGFDGAVQATAVASATALLDGHVPPLVGDQSGRIQDAFTSAVSAFAKPRVISQYLNSLLVTLMRLNNTAPPGLISPRVFLADAQILNLTIQDQTLTANYFSVPREISVVQGPTPPAPVSPVSPTSPVSVGGVN